MSEDEFRLNFKMIKSSEDDLEVTKFGEFEECLKPLGDYESLERIESDEGILFEVLYKDVTLTISSSILSGKFQGGFNRILEIIRALDNIVNHFDEISEEKIEYQGNLSLEKNVKCEEKMFTEISSPIISDEEVVGIGLKAEKNSYQIGISINETDGEFSQINASYGLHYTSEELDEDRRVELEDVVKSMKEKISEYEERMNNA